MTARTAPPGKVRIIGGQWRRRWLAVPSGTTVRPTADRVRETLFNWLMPHLAGARCLDLFAGSGVLGLEAVSRGAAHATLVDTDPALVAQLKTNVAQLAAAETVSVIARDALNFLATAAPQKYQVVFLDPPFNSELVPQVLPLLTPAWLAQQALVYVETSRASPPVTLPEGWRMMRAGETRQTRYCLVQAA
jgi:16S rRNA (guanine966-N2)-methyltransferase